MSLSIKSRIYIIGAGLAGISIAREIKLKGVFGKVIAFLDDDPAKIGKKIMGIPIFGPVESVTSILKTTPDDEAIISIPSGTIDQLKRIFSLLKQANFSRIRILPSISQILEGDPHLIQTREINPEDLLSRNQTLLSLKETLTYVRGKRVLITGAGGSIGSELSRQLLYGGAERLYLFGHGENSIFEIDRELRLLQEEGVGEKATIVPIIGELQDRDYMFYIMKRLRADIIFHAAAHKHVPMMEGNPVAAIKNNFFGTKNLLDATFAAGEKRFVMISTDKAVEPTSIYGASKYLAEELVLRKKQEGHNAIIVRFGNVLGSRGSILPLFKSQIFKGGPVKLTHPEAARFFMTIPEACSLVLKAGGIEVDDCDLLILEMGEPLYIRDLAEQLIRFYGYEPEKEIKFEYIGLRPGEKINERLWSEKESPESTSHPGIIRIKRSHFLNGELDLLLEKLLPVCFFDATQPQLFRNKRVLRELVHSVVPSMEIPQDEPEY